MKRRKAIKNTLLGLGGISLMSSFKTIEEMMQPLHKKTNIGVQLFTIPHLVDKDLRGTLKLLADIGYREIEFFGPYPFSAEATKKEWIGMKQMLKLGNGPFYGYSVAETSQMLKDNNLTAPSVHADIVSMRVQMNKLLDGLALLKTNYVAIPALIGSDMPKSENDFKKLADEFNDFGEQMSKYNMKFVFHNHGFEHVMYDTDMGLDILLKNTNPDYVQFELDIFWMQAAGADPVSYLKKYPNRFKLMHIKDASEKFRFSGDGGSPEQWMEGFPKMRDPGDGVFDIKSIMEEGQKSGVEHFYLERDLAPDPISTLNNSFKNLSEMI
jgi:sugar phosphate isomerase/epimerase